MNHKILKYMSISNNIMRNITVVENDTLFKIANKYNTTIADLQGINDIQDPNNIKVGDVLNLPENVITTNDVENPAPPTSPVDQKSTVDTTNPLDTTASPNMFNDPNMLQNMLSLLSNGISGEVDEKTNKVLEELSDKSSESSYTASIDNLNDIANSIFVNNNGENICEVLTNINNNLNTLIQQINQ